MKGVTSESSIAALSGGPGPHPVLVSFAVRRPQDGTFFKGPPYPGYPFLMIPDLSSPYLSNGPLSPGGARTVSVLGAAPGRTGGWGPGPTRRMRPPARLGLGGMGPPAPVAGKTCLRS